MNLVICCIRLFIDETLSFQISRVSSVSLSRYNDYSRRRGDVRTTDCDTLPVGNLKQVDWSLCVSWHGIMSHGANMIPKGEVVCNAS